MPIIEDETPTERQIPTAEEVKADWEQTVTMICDVVTVTGQGLNEAVPFVVARDKELARLCKEAGAACDRVLTHIINRSV